MTTTLRESLRKEFEAWVKSPATTPRTEDHMIEEMCDWWINKLESEIEGREKEMAEKIVKLSRNEEHDVQTCDVLDCDDCEVVDPYCYNQAINDILRLLTSKDTQQ